MTAVGRAVGFAVLLGAVGLLASFWLLGEDLRTAGTVPAWAYLVGLGLAAVNYLAGAFRLKALAAQVGERVRFVPVLRAYALGLFSAAVTPGSAGQAPAAVMGLVSGGLSAAHAWTVIIRVWVLDLIFLAWSMPLSILVLDRSTRLLEGTRAELVAALSSVAAVLVVALLIFRLSWLTALLMGLMRLPGLRRWRGRLRAFLDRVNEASGNLRRAPLPTQATLHLLTLTVYLTTYLTFYVVVASVRPGAPLLATMASAQVPTVAASFFPTPGGTGLLEVATASLLRLRTRAEAARVVAEQRHQGPEYAAGYESATGSSGPPIRTDNVQGPVAAAILSWRLLTYYLRLVVGPLLGGALIWRKHGA